MKLSNVFNTKKVCTNITPKKQHHQESNDTLNDAAAYKAILKNVTYCFSFPMWISSSRYISLVKTVVSVNFLGTTKFY
jgi:hypothetical protein